MTLVFQPCQSIILQLVSRHRYFKARDDNMNKVADMNNKQGKY